MSLEAILDSAASRRLLPTSMSTFELREIDSAIRARSLFSARTTSVEYLARVADVLDRLGNGEINMATAKAELQAELDALGYTPDAGFGDDPTIPPAEVGSLQDLSSDRRIELMLRTQEELMFGAGQKLAGAERIADYPAWELVRHIVPKGDPRDWQKRWVQVGGELRDGGRMIALKNDPIWEALGNSLNFDDALDTDHPPFAFNSGMRWSELRWDEVEAFDLGEPGPVKETPLNSGLAVSINSVPSDLVEELRRELPVRIEGKKALWQQELEAQQAKYRAEAEAVAARMKNRIIVALAYLNAGTREGAIKGWVTRRAGVGRKPTAPQRISIAAADELLTKGFTEKDSQGRKIHFGIRLKEHIEAHAASDVAGRKEQLEWARETVRTGKAVPVIHEGQARTHYAKIFNEGGKDKGFATIVDTIDGEAFSIFQVRAKKLRRKGLVNRGGKKHQAEEQPSECVLRAIAAAGGLPDYFECSPALQEVKP